MNISILIILVVIAVVFVAYCARSHNNTATTRSTYNYFAKNHIMTKREEEFFVTLCNVFENKCYIVPQVHLSALLNHKVRGQNWRGAFAHINGKSADYVLLRRSDLSVLCAVELDDATHDTQSRAKRDQEVERIFQQAKIPLVRLKRPETMSKQEIVNHFAKILNQ